MKIFMNKCFFITLIKTEDFRKSLPKNVCKTKLSICNFKFINLFYKRNVVEVTSIISKMILLLVCLNYLKNNSLQTCYNFKPSGLVAAQSTAKKCYRLLHIIIF